MIRALTWLLCLSACAAIPVVLLIGRDPPPASGTEFHEKLREIARTYREFQPVDTESRWAPLDCDIPPPPQPLFSASNDEATHGRKLYFLYVNDLDAYLALSGAIGPIQGKSPWVVKESWTPEEVQKKSEDGQLLPPYASREVDYRTDKPAGLYIMFKLDPKTPGTDNGWVYGTVTPDGKTVTSAGRVASCMNCHKDAKHDRLFGLAPILAHDPTKTK